MAASSKHWKGLIITHWKELLSASGKATPLIVGISEVGDTIVNMAEKQDISQLEAAPEIPSPQNGYYVDPAVEKRLVRKLDRKLVPWVMLLCKQNATI